MKSYTHKVNYYETDKMGITHHSNYVRWMEEARIDFLSQVGYSYERIEAEGIISPVLAVDCRYKQSTTFADKIVIDVSVEEFNGVRLILAYTMKKLGEEKIIFTGKTEHCFLGNDGRPVRMKKEFPELYKLLTELSEA